jgi:hypothetical protein
MDSQPSCAGSSYVNIKQDAVFVGPSHGRAGSLLCQHQARYCLRQSMGPAGTTFHNHCKASSDYPKRNNLSTIESMPGGELHLQAKVDLKPY